MSTSSFFRSTLAAAAFAGALAASPAQGQSIYYFTGVLGSVYDTMGRSYRLGIRVKY